MTWTWYLVIVPARNISKLSKYHASLLSSRCYCQISQVMLLPILIRIGHPHISHTIAITFCEFTFVICYFCYICDYGWLAFQASHTDQPFELKILAGHSEWGLFLVSCRRPLPYETWSWICFKVRASHKFSPHMLRRMVPRLPSNSVETNASVRIKWMQNWNSKSCCDEREPSGRFWLINDHKTPRWVILQNRLRKQG